MTFSDFDDSAGSMSALFVLDLTSAFSLQPGKLEGGRISYDIAADSLNSLSANVAELSDRLNDPAWGRG